MDAGDGGDTVTVRLLAWYDRHRRTLPWRAPPGARMPAYRVWLSEIMLQQTTVAAVGPYYETFLARWPTVQALAAAELDDVLTHWQGLGYYSRARNLHRCARLVADGLDGRFPEDEAALLALPGIGPYTAAAIAAIAFDRKATPVDGNVERVVARLFAVTTPLPAAKPELRRLAAGLTPEARSGDFAQATMDLGATVCLPRNPLCLACPLQRGCRARAAGIAAELPARSPRPARPTRHGRVFVALTSAGEVLLRRRPEEGLLGGMMEVWGGAWIDAATALPEPPETEAPFPADWQPLPDAVEHGFTHFGLRLWVYRAETPRVEVPGGLWQPLERLAEKALPTAMTKVLARALAAAPAVRRPPPARSRRPPPPP